MAHATWNFKFMTCRQFLWLSKSHGHPNTSTTSSKCVQQSMLMLMNNIKLSWKSLKIYFLLESSSDRTLFSHCSLIELDYLSRVATISHFMVHLTMTFMRIFLLSLNSLNEVDNSLCLRKTKQIFGYRKMQLRTNIFSLALFLLPCLVRDYSIH